MKRPVAESIYCFNSNAVKHQGTHSCKVHSFPHGRKANSDSLLVDPPIDKMKTEDKNGGSDAHDKSEISILRVVVGSLCDGGMIGPTFLVLNDAHVVSIERGKYNDGKVEDYYLVQGDGTVRFSWSWFSLVYHYFVNNIDLSKGNILIYQYYLVLIILHHWDLSQQKKVI